MSEFDRLKIQVKDQVALVTIDQPEVLNCLNEAMLDELERAFSGRLKQEDLGAVIVTGAGEKAFVAGADIKELAQLDPLEARLKSSRGHQLMELIESFPKPVIAAINGFCLGGGCAGVGKPGQTDCVGIEGQVDYRLRQRSIFWHGAPLEVPI